VPCPKLDVFACSIHDRLPTSGFPGCAAYDCFGAGQRVAQHTFAGRDWRGRPELAVSMFTAFITMRHLHELLWYLESALAWPETKRMQGELMSAHAEVGRAAESDADVLASVDVSALRATTAALLRRASRLVRGGRARDLGGHDFTGTDLRTADLRNADLRNATLLGADLRDVDLGRADLLGADLRAVDLRGANLSATLYLTQSQLGSARGDSATEIPAELRRPLHWTG
jgi:hypothetical protein